MGRTASGMALAIQRRPSYSYPDKKVKAELELDDSDESMREKRSGESVGKKQMVQVKFSYRVQKGASLSDYVKACMNGNPRII